MTLQDLPVCHKDCFVGVVSSQPIGRIHVHELRKTQPWVIKSILFELDRAHVLDSVNPEQQWLFWGAFTFLIIAMLAIDMFCMRGRSRAAQLGEALRWTLIWVLVALAFNSGVLYYFGRGPAVVWLTAYLLEKFLSIDNLFVFLTIFATFKTPARLQHKVSG